jgi:four helix bundle protein
MKNAECTMIRMQNEKNKKDLAQRTKSYALQIIYMYSALPRGAVAQVLGRQVLRSGTSVGANYREANRARSKAEFIAKMGDCLKELDETAYWLELLVETSIIAKSNQSVLLDETSQLIAIFVTIIKKAKAKAG